MLSNYNRDIGNQDSINSLATATNDGKLAPRDNSPDEVLNPFSLKWIFGLNTNVPMVNLSKSQKNQVLAFATLNTCILHDCRCHKQQFLRGHEFEVIYVGCDRSGQFLCTADKRTINIWDRELDQKPNGAVLLHTLEETNTTVSLVAASFSWDAKHIITFDSRNTIKFWRWSFGLAECDGHYKFMGNIYKNSLVNIKFSSNYNESDWFVLTFKKCVAFGQWNSVTNSIDMFKPSKALSDLTDSTYIENTRHVISVSETGQAHIWSDKVADMDDIITNNKEFFKSISLGSVAINCVVVVDGVVAMANDAGEILFYDKEIKLLYTVTTNMDPILYLAFNLIPRNPNIELCSKMPQNKTEHDSKLPVDATLDNNVFLVRDFLISTKTGKLESFDFIKQRSEALEFKSDAVLNYFEVHSHQPWLAVGNANGELYTYNYETKQIFNSLIIPDDIIIGNEISCLAYSRCNFLFCGFKDGTLFIVDTILLKPCQAALSYGPAKIERIQFSDKFNLVAYSDSEFYVYILCYKQHEWKSIGKFCIHSDNIAGLCWLLDGEFPVLVSIGKDRIAVKYNIKQLNVSRPTESSINEYQIEQTAIPMHAISIPSSCFDDFKDKAPFLVLTVNNEHKFKIYNPSNFETLKTIAAPIYESPITHINLITYTNIDSPNKYIIAFNTSHTMGLQMFPLDGNPIRQIAMHGSPKAIKVFRVSSDHNNVFKLAADEYTMSIWRINSEIIKNSTEQTITELEQFCSVLPEGKAGPLFKELLDVFYYIQLIGQNLKSRDTIKIENHITANDVPDFLRGVGFFPTDYEIDNIIQELKHHYHDHRDNIKVDFETLVKLYVNHRPAVDICVREVSRLVRHLHPSSDYSSSSSSSTDDSYDDFYDDDDEEDITEDDLLLLLTERGEMVSQEVAKKYMKGLSKKRISFTDMTQDAFVNLLMGIDQSSETTADSTEASGSMNDDTSLSH